mgnify:CR=1 FL=1
MFPAVGLVGIVSLLEGWDILEFSFPDIVEDLMNLHWYRGFFHTSCPTDLTRTTLMIGLSPTFINH